MTYVILGIAMAYYALAYISVITLLIGLAVTKVVQTKVQTNKQIVILELEPVVSRFYQYEAWPIPEETSVRHQ